MVKPNKNVPNPIVSLLLQGEGSAWFSREVACMSLPLAQWFVWWRMLFFRSDCHIRNFCVASCCCCCCCCKLLLKAFKEKEILTSWNLRGSRLVTKPLYPLRSVPCLVCSYYSSTGQLGHDRKRWSLVGQSCPALPKWMKYTIVHAHSCFLFQTYPSTRTWEWPHFTSHHHCCAPP